MDKKIVALLAAALLPLAASASEVKPGTIEITGSSNLGFGSQSVEETTKVPGLPDAKLKASRSGSNFEAGALYYLTDMVGVGLELGYDRTKQTLGTVTDSDSFLTIGPKVGVDVGVAEKLSVFGEAAILYGTGTAKSEDWADPAANTSFDRSGVVFGVAAGVKYFPAHFASINLGLDYRYMSITEKRPLGEKVVTTVGGLGGFAGVSLYFGN